MSIVEGTHPTLWVLWGVSVLVAASLGGWGVGVWLSARFFRQTRPLRPQRATVGQQIAAASHTVESPAYGKAPVVDREKTVPIARAVDPNWMPRYALVLPEQTAPVVTEEPVHELPTDHDVTYVSGRPGEASADAAELLEQLRDVPIVVNEQDRDADPESDDRDDEPPAAGGGTRPDPTAVMPRYTYQATTPWPPLRWVPPPGPMLRVAHRRMVAGFKAPIRVWRRYSPAAELVASLRSDVERWRADTDALWVRRPWVRTAGATSQRGRHRTGVAAGTNEQRRLSA